MPFRSPQGEGRFESASARRLRCPFSFACCTRFVKWIPYVEVWQWRRFERDCPDSGATMALDCWPICGEDAFQDETSCAKIEVITFPSTIRQEHCCWIRRHRVPAVCTIRRTHSARLDTPDSRLLLSG